MSLSEGLLSIDSEVARSVGKNVILRNNAMSDVDRDAETEARAAKYCGLATLLEVLRESVIELGGMDEESETDILFMQISGLVVDALVDIAEIQDLPQV